MTQNGTMIIPCLGYDDAPAAIEWLCKAFGFVKKSVYPTDNGKIAHAELVFGNIMIMLGSSDHDSEFSKLTRHPREIGGYETQSPYIVVEDVDAHYARAVAAGAKIAIKLKSEDYGGKGYSCFDPEGHLWSFGSYNPWKDHS
jgi:uncharacterized glyoxalase superfamily protein PhnB